MNDFDTYNNPQEFIPQLIKSKTVKNMILVRGGSPELKHVIIFNSIVTHPPALSKFPKLSNHKN